MVAKFYNCTRDERYVFKICSSDQTNTEPVNVEILTDQNNVTHPTIRVQTGRLGRATNYVWLRDFKRFYYVRSWTADHGYVTLNLECDVLMSFRRELMDTEVQVKRNEFNKNVYIPDDNIQMLAPTRVKIKKRGWTSPFKKTDNIFYLAMVSGQGANNGGE